MSIHKTYAVFGLGRYGRAVAKELVASGAEVIAVDVNAKKVEELACDFPICKCADVTDTDALSQLGVRNVDVAVVAMAEALEASVMTVMLLKDMGVGQVIAKAGCSMHAAILEKVGADKVIQPETESGVRLAKNILSSGFADIADLSDSISVIELDVKDEWVGKTILELELRRRYSINIVAVNNHGRVDIAIDPNMKLDRAMKLIIVADKKDINRLK